MKFSFVSQVQNLKELQYFSWPRKADNTLYLLLFFRELYISHDKIYSNKFFQQ